MASTSVTCVGETLWDVLPHGEYLGGAPLNFAAHATRLGLQARLVSRVGDDARGRRALQALRDRGIDTSLVQVDPTLPTGIAATTLDPSGSACYRFPAPCAWDALAASDEAMAAARDGTVVFGTLAQRDVRGTAAVLTLVGAARWRVLDLNLRPPHDQRDVALGSLRHADFVKLNEHELEAIARWLGIRATAAAVQSALRVDFGIRWLCVTEGSRGASLWHEGEHIVQPAAPATVVDTVGAGDAFLAMLLAELLSGSAPTLAMRRAAQLGALVASERGAFPAYDPQRLRD